MKKRDKQKKLNEHHIHWVSVTSFLSAIAGWSLVNFFRYQVYSLVYFGGFLLLISPLLGIWGYVRNSHEEDVQFKRFNNYLSTVGLLTSLVFWIIMFIGTLV